MTGREYDRLQLKNKWDQLKKDWKLWSDLKRGSTGLGWDPVNRTIEASEEWWQERLFLRLRSSDWLGLNQNWKTEPEFEGKLKMMFGGVVAKGKFSAAPSQIVFETTPENVAVELSNDSAEFRSVEPPEIQSTNHVKRPRNER
ncbi:L10-interacting MYB domain-containing protein-like [Phalaenopsis equestris]|uniref:L10-interacting MYB domain-containing protein-like n=1 Tax=Phalaenopsis equestris TaxID=78828 RepID=UPI0009E3E3ED|nr:L10-interacting MYB domain-containing protein-like [Phalaenopsis equestris]